MLSDPDAVQTPPYTGQVTEQDLRGMQLALGEARAGMAEGGVPIGAAMLSSDGSIIGTGRNQRVQKSSAILHGETDCLEKIGRKPASVYQDATIYTTLSPCSMCTGAIILYGIKRVVVGENNTFVGGEGTLLRHGVQVINLDMQDCKALMKEFEQAHPDIWNEDIGKE